MERIAEIDQERVDELRGDFVNAPGYIGYDVPLPGSYLKLDDDVLWLEVFHARVLWGTDDPSVFMSYCLEFGDFAQPLQGEYITDRAPADSEETPWPIWPEDPPGQPQQSHDRGEHPGQMGGRKPHKGDPRPLTLEAKRKIVAAALERLGEETVKRATERIRQTHPELV